MRLRSAIADPGRAPEVNTGAGSDIRLLDHPAFLDPLERHLKARVFSVKVEQFMAVRGQQFARAQHGDKFKPEREAGSAIPRQIIALSDLAVEIIREALISDDQQYVFASPLGDTPMNRKVMATARRGTKVKDKVKTPGICALLGLKPFTPHDLRRTGATLTGDLGFDDAWLAKCLDHAASKKSEQIVPSVTGKVYNHSKRMKEKRAVLDGVAAELRRIIGEPEMNTVGRAELR